MSWKTKSNVEILASPVKGGDRVQTNLSSSEVRGRISKDFKDVQGLCDLSVINFMERNQLYTSKARDIELELNIDNKK